MVKPPDDRQLRLSIDAALSRHAAGRKERERYDTEVSALQDRNDLLEAVIDNMADAVMVTDRDGRFVLSNRAVAAVFGSGPGQLRDLAQAFREYEIFEADERTPIPWERSPLPLAIRGGSSDEVHVFARHPDHGGRHISASGRPLRDSRGGVQGGVVTLRDITAQTMAERELAHTLELLREQADLMERVLDSMSDGVVVLDQEGHHRLVNPRARRLASIGLRDRHFDQFAKTAGIRHADDSPYRPADHPSARVLRGETFDRMEVGVAVEGQQGRVYVEVTGRPLANPDGTGRGGVIVFREVTEDKQREKRLKELAESMLEQKQAMETVLSSISDGVVAADEHGKLTVFNPSAERLVGIGPTTASPSEWSATYGLFRSDRTTPFAPKDLPLVRALRGESSDNVEMFVRNAKNSDGVYVSVDGRPLQDTAGKNKGGVVVFRDVTQLRETQERLQQTAIELGQRNRFMETVFTSISDGVVTAAANGRLTWANAAARRIVGMGRTDAGPSQWSETYGTFFPDEKTLFPADRLPLARAIRGESSDEIELFIRNPHVPDGVYISVSGRPMRDAAGNLTGGVIVFRDVTQRVRSRDALKEAFAQGRLEIIDTVLHNIGNAINSVATGVDTLHRHARADDLLHRFTALADAVSAHGDDWIDWLRDDPQGRKVRPFLLALVEDFRRRNESLRRTAARVSSRVGHIVEIIRTQESFATAAGTREAVNLRLAINDAVRVLEDSLAKRGISVAVECALAPVEVVVLESKFHQLLVNLLKNAMEAIDALTDADGGRAIEPSIRVVARKRAQCLVVDVIDNGIGIDADDLSRIFTAGYTTKERGSGLGLHSAANYAIGTGGSIEPLSEGFGRGTTIRVTLRLPDPRASAGSQA